MDESGRMNWGRKENSQIYDHFFWLKETKKEKIISNRISIICIFSPKEKKKKKKIFTYFTYIFSFHFLHHQTRRKYSSFLPFIFSPSRQSKKLFNFLLLFSITILFFFFLTFFPEQNIPLAPKNLKNLWHSHD